MPESLTSSETIYNIEVDAERLAIQYPGTTVGSVINNIVVADHAARREQAAIEALNAPRIPTR